jgi:4-amino-4-deoxy-L-arabinose transferase-like glycosyltransferase
MSSARPAEPSSEELQERHALSPDRLLLAGLAALALYRLLVLAVAQVPLAPDEAQYYGWSRALDWGYYSKPPVVAIMIRLSTAIFGDSEFGVRALALCLYFLAALALRDVALRLFNRQVARNATFIFITLPVVSFGSLYATTDAPMLFFWSLALACFVRALQTDGWPAWLGLGLAIGGGLLTKYSLLALPAGMALYLLWPGSPSGQNWRRLVSPKPWVAVAIALACLAPNLLWNAAHGGATLRHTAEITQLDRDLFHPDAGLKFLLEQWVVFGLLFAPPLVLAFLRPRALLASDGLRLLVCVSLPLFAVMVLQGFLARANANWAAAAYVGGSILVAVLLVGKHRQRLLLGGLAVNIVLMLVLYHHADGARAIGKPLPVDRDIFWRQRGWPEFAAALRPIVQAYPDAALLVSDRNVAAELTYYLRDLSPRIAAWNPEGHISDHYRLMQDIRQVPAPRYLAIMTNPDALGTAFATTTPLGTVHFIARRPLDYPVQLLEGFKGYTP